MSSLTPPDRIFDAVELRRLARENRRAFEEAKPFSHVVFRDLVPAAVLRRVLDETEAAIAAGSVTSHDHAYQRKGTVGNRENWGPMTRSLFHELNSGVFVDFLESLTGIEHLLPDPHFHGGGLHHVPAGGWLKIHADFSRHERLPLDRRLNVIVYLNEDWDPGWNGALELWDEGMTAPVESIQPDFGTVVVFATTSQAFHGHAEPLQCPPNRSRLSLATYYYTPGSDRQPDRPLHSTLWQTRTGESGLGLRSWVPPVVFGAVRRLRSRRQEKSAPR